MSYEELQDTGPIDYVVLEWNGQPDGEVVPHLIDLVERDIIRLYDVAFMTKAEDGTVATMDVGDIAAASEMFAEFEGANSGLLGLDDLEAAAEALEPGSSAAVLVWENRWAVPLATAVRRSGGQLVASGRIPVQAVVAALDAMEVTN